MSSFVEIGPVILKIFEFCQNIFAISNDFPFKMGVVLDLNFLGEHLKTF